MQYNVTYSDLITFDDQTEGSDGLKISGVAFKVGKIASKKVIIPRSALSAITQTLQGSPILTDHSHSVRDLVGRVKKSWSEGDLVKFSGEILDNIIEDKIRKRLISKVSIGLHVDSIEEKEIDGETWSVLSGVQAKELSLCIFPAVAEAGFTPSFTFSEVEGDDPDPVDAQLTEVDINAMCAVLTSRDKVILDKEDFAKITDQVETIKAEYERTKKMLWLYSNCDELFIAETLEKVDSLELASIEYLWNLYMRMSNDLQAQGVVADDSRVSSFGTAKEDIREIIFHARRDGKKLGGVRSIKDIKL